MAISTKKIKLKLLLESNRSWPLIVSGAGTLRDLRDAPHMPATISVADLNSGEWVHELAQMGAGRSHLYMVIDGMDKISLRAQEKFIRLLKDRRAGMYKLPDNVQIIVPVDDMENVAMDIQRLGIVYDG